MLTGTPGFSASPPLLNSAMRYVKSSSAGTRWELPSTHRVQVDLVRKSTRGVATASPGSTMARATVRSTPRTPFLRPMGANTIFPGPAGMPAGAESIRSKCASARGVSDPAERQVMVGLTPSQAQPFVGTDASTPLGMVIVVPTMRPCVSPTFVMPITSFVGARPATT